jgi:hypothetical protein
MLRKLHGAHFCADEFGDKNRTPGGTSRFIAGKNTRLPSKKYSQNACKLLAQVTKLLKNTPRLGTGLIPDTPCLEQVIQEINEINGGFMKRYIATAVMAVVLTTGLTGCGMKERDELRAKVATMEQDASKMKNEMASKDATIADLRSQVEAANKNARAAQDKVAQMEADAAKAKEAAMKKPAAKGAAPAKAAAAPHAKAAPAAAPAKK